MLFVSVERTESTGQLSNGQSPLDNSVKRERQMEELLALARYTQRSTRDKVIKVLMGSLGEQGSANAISSPTGSYRLICTLLNIVLTYSRISMRGAIVQQFGGPETIKIVSDLPKPVIKTEKQVLVRVAASGVNPVDTYIREGHYAALPTLPYTPGRDGAGIVEQVGEDVSHVKVGDRVYFLANHTGSAAEYCLTDKVFPLPFDVTFQEGACLGIPYMTAHRALFLLGHLKKGQRVLVHGASGGVGLAAVQMAANFGAVVVGTAGTEEGIELVKKNGAGDVFNHRVHRYSSKMKKSYPDGFDLILEMAAHLNLAIDLDLLARNGKVAVIGSRGEVTVNPRALMTKETSAYGVTLANSTEEDFAAALSFIWNFLRSSHFRPAVHRLYPLNEIAAAHSDVMAGSGTKGKLIVCIADL
ncbi:hypothetical protein Y032_0099g3205 [Ancylostoma ceylanicum]|uniref:Enoyl reductase (ER) domain-containing protein n=1 Tax=Ancylostoma ceylanicum TaxID=53326 RepID=A0A016TJ80_9BILA|nr:hypothetical protein Y032_0099g3205 [Ancylostoma ceylanicum]